MRNTPRKSCESWWALSHTTTCLRVQGTPSPVSSPVSSLASPPVSSHHPQPHTHPHANSMIVSMANLPALELCLHKLEGFNGRRKQVQI